MLRWGILARILGGFLVEPCNIPCMILVLNFKVLSPLHNRNTTQYISMINKQTNKNIKIEWMNSYYIMAVTPLLLTFITIQQLVYIGMYINKCIQKSPAYFSLDLLIQRWQALSGAAWPLVELVKEKADFRNQKFWLLFFPSLMATRLGPKIAHKQNLFISGWGPRKVPSEKHILLLHTDG